MEDFQISFCCWKRCRYDCEAVLTQNKTKHAERHTQALTDPVHSASPPCESIYVHTRRHTASHMHMVASSRRPCLLHVCQRCTNSRDGSHFCDMKKRKEKLNKKITQNKTVNQINKNKQGADRSDVSSNQRCKHTRCMKVAQSDAAVKNNQSGFHTVASDRRNHSATQVALPPSYVMNYVCVC